MKLKNLLPDVQKKYQGWMIAYYLLLIITIVDTVRSLIHMLSGDGGAQSIAGINAAVAGGSNIIAIFGQWGASQLVLAVFDWMVVLRYRFLTPLALALLLAENILRFGVGHLKPIASMHTPPGAIGTYVLIPLLLVGLLLSLLEKKDSNSSLFQ